MAVRDSYCKYLTSYYVKNFLILLLFLPKLDIAVKLIHPTIDTLCYSVLQHLRFLHELI